MAPEVGFEPTTNRLTADRSTTELLRNIAVHSENPFTHKRSNLRSALADRSTTELLRIPFRREAESNGSAPGRK